MTTVAQFAASQGIPGVRKSFQVLLANARSTATTLIGGGRNCGIVVVKCTVAAVGAGSSPNETFKIQMVSPGVAAADITAAGAATYAATSTATDLPITAATGYAPSGAVFQVVNTVSGGTCPPAMVMVEYIEDTGTLGL